MCCKITDSTHKRGVLEQMLRSKHDVIIVEALVMMHNGNNIYNENLGCLKLLCL